MSPGTPRLPRKVSSKPINTAGKSRAQVMKALSQRIARVGPRVKAKGALPKRGLGLGTYGTNFAEEKMRRISRIADNPQSLNFTFAQKLFRIYERARSAEVEFSAGEQQVLVNATNRLLATEKRKDAYIPSESESQLIRKTLSRLGIEGSF